VGAAWRERSRGPRVAPSPSARPLIIVSAPAHAMQEGAVSLMQMAKMSAALMALDEAGIPFISVPHRPHHRRHHASFAMLGDLNIGRAGRADRIRGAACHRADHPAEAARGFQRAEFLLKTGMPTRW